MEKCKNCTCEHWTDECKKTIDETVIFDGIELEEPDYVDSTN